MNSVYLITDDEFLGDGLGPLLSSQPGWEKLQVIESSEDIIKELTSKGVEGVLIDFLCVHKNAYEMITGLRLFSPTLFISVMVPFSEVEFIDNMQRYGASMIVNRFSKKKEILHHLAEGMTSWNNGKIFTFYSTKRPASLPRLSNRIYEDELNKLTPREKEILGFIINGTELKEALSLLNISYDTFKTHRKKVFQKLRVENEVVLVRRLGLEDSARLKKNEQLNHA